jgi:hypothetical protein
LADDAATGRAKSGLSARNARACAGVVPPGRHRRQGGGLVVALAGGGGLAQADGAAAAGAALVLELAFPRPGDAGPGAGQPESDAGLGDDLDQAGAAAGGVLAQPVEQS